MEVHPEDAKVHGLENKQWINIQSPHRIVRVQAKLTWNIQKGQLFMPMHDGQTNNITLPDFDPQSRQPSYKYSVVKIINDKKLNRPKGLLPGLGKVLRRNIASL